MSHDRGCYKCGKDQWEYDGCKDTDCVKKSLVSETIQHSILDIKMGDNDADAKTIGEYLKKLLINVLEQQEGFSGKRAFGNSSWINELMIPLARERLISSKFDKEYNEYYDFDYEKGMKLIIAALK